MSNLRIARLALTALAISLLLAGCSSPGSNNVVPGSDDGTYALTVSVQGPGTVFIDAIDFSCSDECTTRIGAGVAVELRAQAEDGKGFVGWQQACTGSGPCTVPMDGDANVSAVFADNVLSLDMAGDGSGTVRIVPPDVNCQEDCAQGYPGPLSVSLTVTLTEGTKVEGWGADCSDSGTSRQCVVDVSGQTDVSLTLVRPPVANPDSYSVNEDQTLSVSAGNGVLSNDSDSGGESLTAELVSEPSDGDLDLNSDGSFTYRPGSPGEYTFSYRARDGSGNLSNTAQVTITVRQLPRHALTVDKTGLGSGRVTSDPSGIDCGSDCSGEFKAGTSVTLTASAESNSSFGGWSGGGCSGSGTTCTVSMNAAKEVTARFDLATFPLSYTEEGTGQGTVTLQPPGRSCTGDCEQSYNSGETVTLDAVADKGSQFDGWSGDCSVKPNGTCEVTMNGSKDVTANFGEVPVAPTTYPLSVSFEGDGGGTVDIKPIGVTCSSDCTEEIEEGEKVTLEAVPDPNSSFTGWSGACSGTQTTCTFSMSEAKNTVATFNKNVQTTTEYPLTLAFAGDGDGTINIDPIAISCSSDCTEEIEEGERVSLTAVEASGSSFTGWNGACSGTNDNCSFLMDGAKNVTATFDLIVAQFALAVAVDGDGSGSIAGPGINCPDDCSETYDEETDVTLTAEPDEGSELSGWSGGCDDETNGRCKVRMDGDKAITARFDEVVVQHLLDVDIDGEGKGTVAGPGIACPKDCAEEYDEGDLVTLTADPGEDSELASWSGCDSETNGNCSLTMNGSRQVKATFSPLAATFTLDLMFTGDGTGSVAIDPSESDTCSEDCRESYDQVTEVTLTAEPETGSVFQWGGECSESGEVCELMVDEDKVVTISFDADNGADDGEEDTGSGGQTEG